MVRQLPHSGLIALTATGRLAVLSNQLTVIDALQGDTLMTFPFTYTGCVVSGSCLVTSDDGRFVAGSTNDALIVADLVSRSIVLTKQYSHTLPSIGALAFASDNTRLIIGGQMHSVSVMALPSGELVDSLSEVRDVVGFSIMPDGRTAALALSNGEVQLWDWMGHAVVDRLKDCKAWCSAAGSSKHSLMAGCAGGAIRVWDSRTLRLKGVIEGYPFIGLRFSGSRMADLIITGSGPGTLEPPAGVTTSGILVFDASTLQLVASWRGHDHRGILYTTTTPDASLFATCGYDGTIAIWRFKP
jgi:WD40 repeat protein